MNIGRIIQVLLLFVAFNSQGQKVSFGTEINLSQQSSKKFIEDDVFVKNEMEHKRLVLLGEMNHGDGTTFKAKTSLIKYFHENLGFNFLILENSIFNSDVFWQLLNGNDNVQANAEDHIYKIWSQIQETKELFKYLSDQQRNGTPIKLLGIDPQFSGKQNSKVFIQKISTLIGESENSTDNFKKFSYEIELMGPWLKSVPDERHQISRKRLLSLLEYYKNVVLSKVNDKDKEIWQLYFENFNVFLQIKWPEKNQTIDVISKREERMYQNLKYHISSSPTDSKFILWAASSHIMKNFESLDANTQNRKTLGDFIYDDFENVTYSIAVTAGQGTTLNIITEKNIELVKTKRKSLEWYLRKSSSALLISLKKFEKYYGLNRYSSKILNMNIASKWSENFDACIYIKEMLPSTNSWD